MELRGLRLYHPAYRSDRYLGEDHDPGGGIDANYISRDPVPPAASSGQCKSVSRMERICSFDLDTSGRSLAGFKNQDLNLGEGASPDRFFLSFRPASAELINQEKKENIIMKHPVHSIKMQRSRRTKINSIEHKRWAAYATAALSSGFTFSLAESAVAEIHYSGPIKQDVPNGYCSYSYPNGGYCYAGVLTLPLGDNGNIKLTHSKTRSIYGTETNYLGGSAFLKISAPGAAVRGSGLISRLLPGNVISAGPFAGGSGLLATYWGARGQFQTAGQGFAGFKFNTGAGEQYGWVRVRMNGFPTNSFAVVDYAYGDPGEVVKAGQKRSHSLPDLESLGGLALGAAGLLAWRRRRANQRAAA